MKWIVTFIVALVVGTLYRIRAQEVIAKDSVGMIVEVKEKYGGLFIDTCTVVMLCNDQFVLVKRSGKTAWFPTSFHSVRVMEKFSEQK